MNQPQPTAARTARTCPSGGDATATVEEYRAEVRKAKQMPKEKWDLICWLVDEFGDELHSEYRFHPVRKWRFDWALPRLKLAIEYDGLFGGGAHTSVRMVAKDSEKMNAAQLLGWIVIRVNAKSLESGRGYLDIDTAKLQRLQEAP